jgi:hypothetical protein
VNAARSAVISAHLLAEAQGVAHRRVVPIPLPLGLSAEYWPGVRRRPERKRSPRRTYLRPAPSYPTRGGVPALPVAV